MKTKGICWIHYMSAEDTHQLTHTYTLMHVHYPTPVSVQSSWSFIFYLSSKPDACKCIILNRTFTVILISYDSVLYLFQGDELVNSYFQFC